MAAPVAVQLYSLREEAARDFRSVLRSVGDAGFVGVELAGYHDLTPAEVAAVLADCGLVVASGHVGPDPALLPAALDALQTAGGDTAIVAFLPPATFATESSVAEAADQLNACAAIAADAGVTLGYHNHWWEFEQRFGDERAWWRFLDLVDPAVVVELDMYWATVGGDDPKAVIGRLGDRLRLLHVKDGPGDDPEAPMVAVGSGALDITGLLESAPWVDWHVVELDRCATDMTTAVADSCRWLTSNGLSAGRS